MCCWRNATDFVRQWGLNSCLLKRLRLRWVQVDPLFVQGLSLVSPCILFDCASANWTQVSLDQCNHVNVLNYIAYDLKKKRID